MSRSASAAAVLVLACMTVTLTAAARGQSQARFGIGLGLTGPEGKYRADVNGDGFNTGWQGLGFLEFKAPGRPLGLRVDVVFGANPGNDQLNADVSAAAGQPATVKMRMLGGNVDVIYSFGRASRGGGGYLLGGIGSYRATLSTSSGGVTVDTSETRFAWNVGGGLSFPVGRAAMFVELRYIDVATAFSVGRLPFVALTAGFRSGRR
jgi:opacity protein-like surface antigen